MESGVARETCDRDVSMLPPTDRFTGHCDRTFKARGKSHFSLDTSIPSALKLELGE
jgi:hypothetical protein